MKEYDKSIWPFQCAKPTASIDRIFSRHKNPGTLIINPKTGEFERLSMFRPPCTEGVIISEGLLHWGPWICKCGISLYGTITLCSAGNENIIKGKRLEIQNLKPSQSTKKQVENSWNSYRGNNLGHAASSASIAEKIELLWTYKTSSAMKLTAPVVNDKSVFVAGKDGVLTSLDLKSGKSNYQLFTAGMIHFPPSLWENKGYLGSGDGWMYCFDQKTGKINWRFRGAPTERRMPIYESICSTWPIGSGVLVEGGKAYFAAGLTNYDTTFLYSLNAENGQVIWEKSSTGSLDGNSILGHLLLKDKILYMGGESSIPAYNISNGEIIKYKQKKSAIFRQLRSKTGKELYCYDNHFYSSGKYLYNSPNVFESRFNGFSYQDDEYLYVIKKKYKNTRVQLGKSLNDKNNKWVHTMPKDDEIEGLVLTKNIALILSSQFTTKTGSLLALNRENGKEIWKQDLHSIPVSWGIAVANNGTIIVTMVNGNIIAIGKKLK